jgi:hypothetical protein
MWAHGERHRSIFSASSRQLNITSAIGVPNLGLVDTDKTGRAECSILFVARRAFSDKTFHEGERLRIAAIVGVLALAGG